MVDSGSVGAIINTVLYKQKLKSLREGSILNT